MKDVWRNVTLDMLRLVRSLDSALGSLCRRQRPDKVTVSTLLAICFYWVPVFPMGCSSRTAPGPDGARAVSSSQQKMIAEVRAQLETIPPPSKTRFMSVKSLTSWENPYLTVQDSMLTLHVMLADANTSQLGQGGMLRPVGARRQDLTIRMGELAGALNAVPQSAWPYGRVIAVEEAHNAPTGARPQVRRNMEAVMKTLGELGVVVYEWSEGGAGLR